MKGTRTEEQIANYEQRKPIGKFTCLFSILQDFVLGGEKITHPPFIAVISHKTH